jgi:hypothetical protein
MAYCASVLREKRFLHVVGNEPNPSDNRVHVYQHTSEVGQRFPRHLSDFIVTVVPRRDVSH